MKTLLLFLALISSTFCFAQDGSLYFQCGAALAQVPFPAPQGPPTIYAFAVVGGTFVEHKPYCNGSSYRWHSGARTDSGLPGDYSQGATFAAGGSLKFLSTQANFGFCNQAPYCAFHGTWASAQTLAHQVNSNGNFTETFCGELVGTFTDVYHPLGAKAHANFCQPTVASPYPFDPNGGPQTVGAGYLNLVVGQ